MLRDDTAASARSRRISIIEAAQQIGLKDLQPSDVIDFSRCAEGLMVRAGDGQVERLKLIGLVARRDIAAYNERQFMSAEVGDRPKLRYRRNGEHARVVGNAVAARVE